MKPNDTSVDWARFQAAWAEAANLAHRTACDHGFDQGETTPGETIALMHSELSEALEAFRRRNPRSSTIPFHSQMEEELADLVIRVMDAGNAWGMNLGCAIRDKMLFNVSRPYRHGNKEL